MSAHAPARRARRRLFSEDEITHEAKVDNLSNILQETIARERMEKRAKWNFDFEKELPLEGTYVWEPVHHSWIGKERSAETYIQNKEVPFKVKNEEVSMKELNEVTPRHKETEVLPQVRKRRIEELGEREEDKGVRRKISFE